MASGQCGHSFHWRRKGYVTHHAGEIALEIIDHTYGVPEMFFRFNHTDGKLIVNQPYLSNRKDGDEPYDDLVTLGKVGINSLEEAFNVESLSSSNMILNNGVFRLRFKKM